MEAQEHIISDIDIVEYINKTVQLKKKGSNYFGNCPFHEEKTSSFSVSQSKRIYKCFGCGKAGNVIKYVMDRNKLSWKEAIEDLASSLSLQLTTTNPEEKKKRTELEEILNDTLKIFEKTLQKTPEMLDYLQSRGITTNSITQYHLGYNDDSRTLINKLQEKGHSLEDMERIGIIAKKPGQEPQADNYFERFRNRIIFPIHNEHYKLVGFAGRINPLIQDPKMYAKYINSPESELYIKGNHLYGLAQIRNELIANKEAHLVEGYTDVILMNQQKLWSVASSGTSLTEKQSKILSKLVTQVNILRDADLGGITATKRDYFILIPNKLQVTTTLLPVGEDPASFIQKYSINDFNSLKKLNLAEFWYSTLKLTSPNPPVAKKIEMINQLIEEIDFIPNPVSKFLWLKEVGTLLDIPPVILTKLYMQHINENNNSDFIDYFSTKHINMISGAFIAKLLRTEPTFAKAYLRDIPLNKIPTDGSIFSQQTLKLYSIISNQLLDTSPTPTLFGIDDSIEHHFGAIDSKFDATKHHFEPFEVKTKTTAKLKNQIFAFDTEHQDELQKEKGSIELMFPDVWRGALTNYKLDELTKMLRAELYLVKQKKLLDKISDELTRGKDSTATMIDIEDAYNDL
jgi:DNA primase catalytic core